MSKISELGPISGANTRTEDLFVIVNLVQGDDGTKNITRRELVEAIQYETFSRIRITGGSISGVVMFDSFIRDVTIDTSNMEDSEIIRTDFNNGSLRNSTGENLTITDSTFTDGGIFDSTGNNMTITDSTFSDGDVFDSNANNIVITSSSFSSGVIFDTVANTMLITLSDFSDGTGNNNIWTNSQFNNGAIDESTGNNMVITNSEFNDGDINSSTGDDLTITNSTFDQGSLTNSDGENLQIVNSRFDDGDADNVNITNSDITDSTFNQGNIIGSDVDDVTIINSSFADGTLANSTANTLTITTSDFSDGTISNSTANTLTIIESDFSDGTGNNNVFDNTTLPNASISDSAITTSTFDDGVITDSAIANAAISDSTATNTDIDNSTFDQGSVTDSTFREGQIFDSELTDFEMDLKEVFDPNIDEESWFALKNAKTGETERITYAQFYDELSKTVSQALKIHVDSASGNDAYPGSVIAPVRTLEKACELALEKAGGKLDRNDVNNAVHISVGPGTYYTKGNLSLPDDCSATSTSGQYATVIEALPGYENNNCWLVGSGGYLQGFSYTNWKVDNFDYPEGGFAVAYRPGATMRRSPYLRDSTQLSNFLRADIEPPLNPFNSKGTVYDLGREIFLSNVAGAFAEDDKVYFSSGAEGYVSNTEDLPTKIYIRNLKNNKGFQVGDTIYCRSGGTAIVDSIGIDDFPNREVGRGGGCVLADRRVLSPDSLYTYVLCFGFTPRTQNGIGYVARDGAGINGIGSLSIFTRCAFYALNGGQVTLNNSGSQFGDISMRAKNSTKVFQPKATSANIIRNVAFAETLELNANNIIDDVITHLTANTADGGLGYTGYDSGKCERDSGIIIDGVGLDIALDSNYWGRLAGITYRSPISYIVINDQLEPTVGANQYLQGRIEDIFASANSAINERANTSFQELYNIIEYGEDYDTGLTLAPTGNTQMEASAELILDNKEFIQDQLIDWIDNNENFYTYNSKTCRRDTEEYIIPAVYYDTLLDTNYNSVTAGNAYYMSTAAKVIDKQKEETVSAYARLKDQINETVDGISSEASFRADKSMDYIIDILNNAGTTFTPTNATYDPVTGVLNVTIGTHSLKVGQKVLLAPLSIGFSCIMDNNRATRYYPRVTDPIYNKPVYIDEVTATTITVNVGDGGGYTGAHTYVASIDNAISVVGEEITFSDNAAIDVSRRNARKQLQANRNYIEDNVVGWINNNFYVYDQASCRRDTGEYILPAIQRDMLLGTNYNAVQAGVAYYTATAQYTIDNQKVQTSGAFSNLKTEVASIISGNQAAVTGTNASFDEIIDILDNGVANANVLEFSDPASYLQYYTPTNATYDPVTGISVVTVNDHGLSIGDAVRFAPYSFTFTCAQDGNATEHSYPRVGDINYNQPMIITAASTNTFTVTIGAGAGGAHTFVSASVNAVHKTSELTQGYYAREQLQANRSFLQEEVVRYLSTLYYTFDGEKCSRDTALIIDAARRDVSTGSNFNAVFSGLAYRVGTPGAQNVVNSQLPETTAAIGFVRDEIAAELTGTSLTRSNASFNEIIDILSNGIGNADVINFGTHTVGANQNTARVALQLNKTFLQAEITAWLALYRPDLTYSVQACERDLGILIDSVSFDIQHGGNTASVNNAVLYFENAVLVLPEEQREETADAFEHIASVVETILRDQEVVPTIGNVVAQDQSQTDVGISVSGKVRSLIRIVSDAIRSDTAIFPKMIEPSVETGFEDAVREIDGKRSTLANDVIEYLELFQNGYAYSEAKCARDVGFIIDAACKDIEYGGNASSIDSALYYFEARSSFRLADNTPFIEQFNVLPEKQRIPTVQAFTHLASVATDIVQENAVTASTGNTITQNTAGTPADATTAAAVSALITIVVDNVGKGSPDNIPSIIEPAFDPNRTSARRHLQANREFLVQDVIKYLDDRYFVYDDAKCSRDTGILLDAVKRDVVTGSNFNAVFNGLAYRSGTVGSDAVVNEQLTETVGALEYVRDQALTSIVGANAKNAFTNGYAEIIDIMRNGSSNADVINFGSTSFSPQRNSARINLQNNKLFLQKEMTAYLNDNYYTYDDVKCKRDTGFIVDAVQLDVLTGSNYAAVQAGVAYNAGTAASTLANEKVQTIASFNALKAEMLEDITDGPSQTRITNAVDEVIDIINNGTGAADAIVFTDPGVDNNKRFAREQLQANRAFIIQEITQWIAENLPEYDAALCTRDIGYIIDAVRRDLILGTNHNTITAGDAYLRQASRYINTPQVTYTIAAVEYARDSVKALPSVTSDAAIDVLFQRVIDVLNKTVTNYVLPSYPTTPSASAQTADIIAAVVEMRNNRAAIANSVVSAVADQYPDHIYDVNDCIRDTGYIIDALSHDVKYGGNSAIIRAADAYFVGTVSQLGPTEKIPTIFAYQKLKEIINEFITTDAEQDRVIALLEIVIDVIDLESVSGLPSVVEPTLTGLTTTEHDAIVAGQGTIAANTPVYIRANYPVYDVAACERDTGYIIDAVSHDVQYGGNRATRPLALMYFNNEETNVLPEDQRNTTRSAYLRLATVMSEVVIESVVTPSTGVVLTQDTSGTPATVAEATEVLGLANIIANVIDDDTAVNVPGPIEPDPSWAASNFASASATIAANKTIYQNYIVEEFLSINYTNEECTRDLGYIVDAVRRDLILGTNHNVATAANAYLRDSYTGAAKEAEVAIINDVRDRIKALTNVTSDATIDTYVNTITDMIDGTTSSLIVSTFPATPGSGYQTGDILAAADAIQTNRAAIITEVTDWIQANRPEVFYHNSKCESDLGYIINAVRRDLILGTTHNTTMAGNAYLNPVSNYPSNDQAPATIAAINYARDLVTQLPGVRSIGEINDLFKNVTNGIDGTWTVEQPTFIMPTEDGVATYQSEDRKKTVAEVIGGRQTIINDLIEYIGVANPLLTYDVAKCERDTGRLIDGFMHDLLFGGTTATTVNAEFYFVDGVIQLSTNELAASIDAYEELKSIMIPYIDNVGAQLSFDLNTLIDIIINVLTNETLTGMPAAIEVDVTGLDTTEFDAITAGQATVTSSTVAWTNNNFPTYDVADCERDTGFVLDSVTHDIKYGGNTSSRLSAIAYLDGAVNTNIGDAEELAAGIAAYTQLKTILDTYITTAPEQTAKDTLLDIIIDVLTAGNLTGLPAVAEPDLTGLATTEHDAIVAGSTTAIAESVQFANDTYPRSLGYNAAKCERDVGYLVDSISWDLQHDSNTASRNNAILYFENAVLVGLPTYQRAPAVDSFNHIATVANDIINNQAVTPTTGNAESQTFGTSGGAVAGQLGEDLVKIVSNAINANSLSVLPAPQEPSTAGIEQELVDAVTAIDLVKPDLQKLVITHINTEFNGLGYNVAKCERDTGYIVDSISHDIQYAGNSATLGNAAIYFENAINVLPITQREPTKKAFTHLGSVIEKVVKKETIVPELGKTFTPSNAQYYPSTGVFSATIGSHNLVAGDYIWFTPNGITFSCDMGGGVENHTAPQLHHPYYNKPCPIVAVTATSIILNVGLGGTGLVDHTFVSALPNSLTQVIGNTVGQDTSNLFTWPTIATEAKNLALMIANVADDATSANLPERVDPETSWINSTLVDSKELIEDAKYTLIDATIDYIASNLNGLGYDELRCRRDLNFIIDGLSHDVQYGGNFASRINAQIYFENAISVLAPGTIRQTADVYEYLSELVQEIVQGNDVQANDYTTLTQDFSNDSATSAEGARAKDLVQIIETAIRANDVNTIPEIIQPDTSWVESSIKEAGELLLTNTPVLSQDIIDWIADNFAVLDYDRVKCKRDTSYILEAFAYDLHYGGNLATRWNTDFYYWNGTQRLPEAQREPTAQAYRELGLICEKIVKGTYPGQIAKGELGTDLEGNRVRRFGQSLYEVLYFDDVKKLPARLEPDYALLNIDKDFTDAKDSLGFLRTALSADTVRFVGATYGFVDIPLTRRDTNNLLSALRNDFSFSGIVGGSLVEGSQQATRTYTASFFGFNGDLVFPTFNPTRPGLTYVGTTDVPGNLPLGQTFVDLNIKLNDAYIVASNIGVSNWAGDVYFWNGVAWQFDAPNNTELLDAFVGCWEFIRSNIITNYSPNSDVSTMLDGLINDCLKDNVLRPETLVFGSLVESIAHQFNGASAGVNRNALPLNFRNLGSAISALASVLYEEGGRIRWSGSDELNNQYFARGLRINGRTGRIEGRPFTSSVRKLARRASQSRAFV